MPTYDYHCTACGQAFEVFQKMSDEPLSSCPDCGAGVRRKISGGAGFLFKGDGFYITDHRSQEYRDRAAADEGKKKPAEAEASKDGASDASKKSGEKRAGAAAEPARSSSGKDSAPAPAEAGSGGASSGTGRKSRSGAGSRR